MTISSLDLAERFYLEVLRRQLGDTPHSAALIGEGSEVLGYDDETSRDHDWGPRAQIFLAEDVRAPAFDLPSDFLGHSVACKPSQGRANAAHRVEVHTLAGYLRNYLGVSLSRPLEALDWLAIPEQKLLGFTSGRIFHDDLGLGDLRAKFAYYPESVWHYQLAAAWNRIGQEEHLMGRAGQIGDQLGASLISGRLARDLMRILFLLNRRYAPYPKWFGAAFARVPDGPQLRPTLERMVGARTFVERERAAVEAFEYVATRQAELLGIAAPKAGLFFGRPYRVIEEHAGFARKLSNRITDPVLRKLAERRILGGIDFLADNTDLLCAADFSQSVKEIYAGQLQWEP